MLLRAYRVEDEAAVVALWQRCGLVRPVNDPRRDIARKLDHSPEQFLVGTINGELVATAMAGYDGHRGWINYLAVAPDRQKAGLGAEMVAAARSLLGKLGCPKLNVQVRTTNADALEFYRKLGFVEDLVVSLGKRMVRDH